MADDIVTRLQCAYPSGEWPCEECTFCAARAEIERLRGWIDALEPRQGYEAIFCPLCHAATEYKWWSNVEQHKDGCPWHETARKEARRD